MERKKKPEYKIIVNGVNKKIFYPNKKNSTIDTKKIKFITTGSFRNIDMIEPVVMALDSLKGKIDFELNIVGPIINPAIEAFFQKGYINILGVMELSGVAKALRESDIFIYSHLNPPCPNSVIEAISCGLPVVGFDSGAMSELCYFSKELLAYVSDDIFQEYKDFDYKEFADKILFVVEKYDEFKKRALKNSYLYSFDECGSKYVDVFNEQIKKVKEESRFVKYFVKKIKNIKKKIKKIIYKKRPNIDDIKNEFIQLPYQQLSTFCYSLIEQKCKTISPFDSLHFLFDIENKLYQLEGRESIRYGDGIHTKHKHIKYHDFFIRNISEGSRILDVGCGYGALAYDIALKVSGSIIYGIDINQENIDIAKKRFSRENINFVLGDALSDLPDKKFDVIMLSNVLEYIEHRVDFFKKLKNKYKPKKFLIRVPIFERDWRVPLKEELCIDYRLDPTHFIEYKQEEFWKEIKDAGLNIKHYQIKLGEIWAEIV